MRMTDRGKTMTLKIITPEEQQLVYKTTYKEALEWSEEYEVSLSEKHWNPNRPADRERYFCSQHTDWIMKNTAQAQLEADQKVLDERDDCYDGLLESYKELKIERAGLIEKVEAHNAVIGEIIDFVRSYPFSVPPSLYDKPKLVVALKQKYGGK